ncbi:HNH endonuclease [Streptomyces sioyaensis]|uniref:HNH endonuclease n=1 Tax=Streptomyces sioyaensis TaxID=67364 RepID=UPI003683FB29
MAWKGSTRRRSLPRNWAATVKRIKRRDGYRCTAVFSTGARCIQPGTDVDHVIPHSLGGTDEDDNLRLLCSWCHARKSGQEGAAASARNRVRTDRPAPTHPALED